MPHSVGKGIRGKAKKFDEKLRKKSMQAPLIALDQNRTGNSFPIAAYEVDKGPGKRKTKKKK